MEQLPQTRMKPKRIRGYQHRLLMLAQKPEFLTPGTISTINVQHDDWCKSNKKKPCNCFPVMIVRSGGATYHMDEQGNLVSQN